MMPNFSWPLRNKRLWIAGHEGMVGQALMRRLGEESCECLIIPKTSLDLRRQADVENWLSQNRPDAVIIAAATVGGIGDNAARPADFLYDNLIIAANIIEACHSVEIDRLLFLGSSCIYPRHAEQPIQTSALLTGSLEPTNEAYALAKIAGIKLCQSYRRQYGRAYISAMPCNLYGPNDRFDPVRGHVVPALLMKMHQAKFENRPSITLWGTGSPLREFLHVDDLAAALILLLQDYNDEPPVNIGSGIETSINDLARQIAAVTRFEGDILFDATKPNGAPRKVMDSTVIRELGWRPALSLSQGLADAYRWYVERVANAG